MEVYDSVVELVCAHVCVKEGFVYMAVGVSVAVVVCLKVYV